MTNWRDDKRQPGETAEQHKARMRAKVEAIHERYSGEPTEADMSEPASCDGALLGNRRTLNRTPDGDTVDSDR